MENKITETLGMLYDMELNNYLTMKSIDKIREEIQSLGIPREITREKLGSYSRAGELIGTGTIFAVIFGVLGLIGGLIYGLIANDTNIFERIFVAPMIAVMVGIPAAAIGAGIGAIVSIPLSKKGKKDHEISQRNLDEIYKRRLKAEDDRIEKEKNAKQIMLSEQQVLENRLSEGKKKLVEFYSSVGIAYEYRNIMAIGYMLEYARLGISTKLEGVDGLYFLIKKEIQAEKLQYTLEELSRKMDVIIDKQDSTYRALQAMDLKCNSMIAETRRAAEMVAEGNQRLRQIEYNSYISAYNAKRIETELEYQNYILNNF